MDENSELKIYGRSEFLDRIYSRVNNEDIDQITDIVIDTLFSILKEGKSFQYDDNYPLIKTKISKPNMYRDSPRTPRKARLISTIKYKY